MPARLLVLLVVLGLGLCAVPAAAQEEPLAIYYFHRPPYYFSASRSGGGLCQGVVLSRLCQALRQAGIPFELVELPVKRVLQEIRQGRYGCGVGWYKMPERLEWANFSQPLYHGQPPVVVVNRGRARGVGLPQRPTLEQVLTSGLTLGIIDGYAYGEEVETQIARLRPPISRVSGGSGSILRMVASGRCDLWLVNGEEAQWLMEHYKELAPALEVRHLADAQASLPRHLMCSKQVGREVMERIDRAIAALERHAPPSAPPARPGQR